MMYTVTCDSRLQTGFGCVSGFIDHSQIVITNNYNTLKNTVTITHKVFNVWLPVVA
jgi:hypothetical protein